MAGVSIASNKIDTIGGTGLPSPYDGGLATSALLNTPTGVVADANNNLYITDTLTNRLRFVNRGASAVTIFAGTAAEQIVQPGAIVTVNKNVGTGSGDNAPVSQAAFDTPQGMAITAQGIFIADSRKGPLVPATLSGKHTGLIRFINTTSTTVMLFPQAAAPASPILAPPGNIVTIAGGGQSLSNIGDGNFALSNAKLLDPTDVAANPVTGDIYIADAGNKAVRKIDKNTGLITSVATGAQYTGLGFDASGRLYIACVDTNHILREQSAGSGVFAPMDADPGLNKPKDVAVDAAGNAYVTNSGDHRILKISPSGRITTFAGSTQGCSGDPGNATSAQLDIAPRDINLGSPTSSLYLPQTVSITLGPSGEILFTDSNNNRIRRLR